MKRLVAIISGGPDSIGYAAQWQKRGYTIYPIIFNYGQKCQKEIEVAKKLSKKLNFKEPLIVNINSEPKTFWEGTQLTDSSVAVEGEYKPTVVVPIRNVVFLSVACAYALTIGAEVVTYGAHISDIERQASGEPLYPDCTPETAISMERLVSVAHFPVGKPKIEIWSPAREQLNKAQNLKKTFEIIGDLIYETWSCYETNIEKHCGKCESCNNRKMAFKEAGIEDRTEYEVY